MMKKTTHTFKKIWKVAVLSMALAVSAPGSVWFSALPAPVSACLSALSGPVSVCLSALPKFTMEAQAATKVTLETPEPYVIERFTAAWERVEHAPGYEVKITMQSQSSTKSVTRTITVTRNRMDLSLFAAGNTVSFQVRALAGNSSKYKNSGWGACEDSMEPLEWNQVHGFPTFSGDCIYMTDEENKKLSGWQLVNDHWYYFDPANKNLAAAGWKLIDGAWFYFQDDYKMATGWVAINNHWYYFSTTSGLTGRMAIGWQEAGPNNPCYFTEQETADQPLGSLNVAVTQASYPNSKPPYELTKPENPAIVTPVPSGSGTVQPQNYWSSGPNGSWAYYKGGKVVKNSWENIDGFWYYFNSNGLMLTGWQYIGGCWYYLEPNAGGMNGYKQGARWANATTPDGYTVNADGKWVQNGVVVTEKGTGQSAQSAVASGIAQGSYGSLKQITKCSIRLSFGEGESGKCRTCSVTGASYSTVKSVSYSTPYENWNAGTPITITVVLEPQQNYVFTAGTTFTANDAKVSGSSGDSLQKSVRISYTPTIKLDAPGLIYFSDGDTLRWSPVSKAKRYRLKFSGGDSGTKTYIVTEPVFNLTEYGDIFSMRVKLELSALGSENNKSYVESDKATISDLDTYRNNYTLYGSFEQSEGKVRFRNDSGELLTGWQNLCGSWYHFKNNGWADGPGWYQDVTGYWYYFDGSYRMKTGTVTVGGVNYVLNDGSRVDLPLGAWIQ